MQFGPLRFVCIGCLVPVEERLHFNLLLEIGLTFVIDGARLRVQLILVSEELQEHLVAEELWAVDEYETLEVDQELRLASLTSVSHISWLNGFFIFKNVKYIKQNINICHDIAISELIHPDKLQNFF